MNLRESVLLSHSRGLWCQYCNTVSLQDLRLCLAESRLHTTDESIPEYDAIACA